MSQGNPYRGAGVKRNLLHFFFGRAGSAAITFLSFAAIVRWLPLAEYGLYMLSLAIFEVMFALSLLGFEWVSARCIPEARLKASYRQLMQLIHGIAAIQLGAMLLAALILVMASSPISIWLGEPRIQQVALILAVFLVIEGIARLIRDQFLAALMLQGLAQLGQVLRNLTVLFSVLLAQWLGITATAHQMLWIELLAASVACVFALIALLSERKKLRLSMPSVADFTIDWLANVRLALSAYINYLCTLPVSPWVITFLLSRFIGAEAVAIYGFARSFADQVRRYIPIYLLAGIVQPVLAAHWAETRDVTSTSLRLSLLYKISILCVLPLLLIFSLVPTQAATVLGGMKMASAGEVLALFMLLICFYCLRRVTEISSHLLGHADVTAKVALGMLLALPIVYLGLQQQLGVRFVLWVMIVAEAYFVIGSLYCLRLRGSGFALGLRRLSLNSVLLMGALFMCQFMLQWLGLLWVLLFLLLVLLLLARYAQFMSRSELQFIFNMLPQRFKSKLNR